MAGLEPAESQNICAVCGQQHIDADFIFKEEALPQVFLILSPSQTLQPI